MALELYKKKRNFKETPEPEGKQKPIAIGSSQSKLAFVIQRHKASHLHYDFRLEMDGVLKSWAVPKGPSLNPKDKRLAMMVEDHPYDYKDFSGVIPSGYGAGIVEIWDEGTYSDLENSDMKTAQKNLKAGLAAGNLKIRMFGKKLKGEFALVKLKGKQPARPPVPVRTGMTRSGGDNTWLLIKHNDEGAVQGDYNSEEHNPKNSPINKWLAKNDPDKLVDPLKAKSAKKSPAVKKKNS